MNTELLSEVKCSPQCNSLRWEFKLTLNKESVITPDREKSNLTLLKNSIELQNSSRIICFTFSVN